MRTCMFCRTDNADDVNRCVSCGRPLASHTTPDGDSVAEPPPAMPPLSVPPENKEALTRHSKKIIAAITGIAILVIAGAGAGITYAMGMWGGHARPSAMQPLQTTQKPAQKPAQKPQKSQETTQKGPSGDTTDAAASDQMGTKNDQTVPGQDQTTPENTAKYHVSAQSYEFDLPQYWHNHVLVQVDGDAVTVLSKEYPDTSTPICTIHVANGAEPTVAGDAGTILVGFKTLDNNHHIEVWMPFYPEIAALSDIELKSDAEYTELTDLQTGGHVDFAKERAFLEAHEAGLDAGEPSDMLAAQSWLRVNLIDTLTTK